jgi:predicted nucleic acid-binding Zn ribbon protein
MAGMDGDSTRFFTRVAKLASNDWKLCTGKLPIATLTQLEKRRKGKTTIEKAVVRRVDAIATTLQIAQSALDNSTQAIKS